MAAYFEKFLHAGFDHPEVRDQVLEYFIDKVYVSPDEIMIAMWYSAYRGEILWAEFFGEGDDPFVKGEALQFDRFPAGSTPGHCREYSLPEY